MRANYTHGGWVTVRLTSRWPYNPLSLVVGVLSGSRQFSHAIAIIGERAYEASMSHACRAGTLDELMDGVALYRDMDVWVPDLGGAIAFAEAQVGKRYDWAGAIGIPFTFSEDWNDDTAWWCSELVFAIILAGGVELLDPAYIRRVRPIDLHMIAIQKSALVRVRELPAIP
ncbi:hypothetical protein [Massilia sp. KIM]|uniref:hypothetical protein n=1 Tax=Massilia sp. KIM TaxID=1955422 RepID=UPI00117D3DB7|nr:hypothetical protein [Massilia sp. KIM]